MTKQAATELRRVTKTGMWRGREELKVGSNHPFTLPLSPIVERRTAPIEGAEFSPGVEEDNDEPKPLSANELIEQIKKSEDPDFLEKQYEDERKTVAEAAEKRLEELGLLEE